MASTAWHSLADPWTQAFMRRALAEILLVAVAGGAVGTWVVLYELSFAAESLSHSILPGLVGAALLGVPLLLGAGAGVLVAAGGIALVGAARGIEGDTAVAVVVTTLVGLGALLALSPASPPSLDALLFGAVLGAGDGDLLAGLALVAVIAALLVVAHPRLVAVGFDPHSSATLRVSAVRVRLLLAALLALAVLVGVQGLGSLLVLALVVGPAATARRLSNRIPHMILVAVAVGALGGVAGLYLSYYANVAAGAAIAGAIVVLHLVVRTATPGYAHAR